MEVRRMRHGSTESTTTRPGWIKVNAIQQSSKTILPSEDNHGHPTQDRLQIAQHSGRRVINNKEVKSKESKHHKEDKNN